jgi:hypothetical protein
LSQISVKLVTKKRAKSPSPKIMLFFREMMMGTGAPKR